jgi:SAM-dependent methyltransferase
VSSASEARSPGTSAGDMLEAAVEMHRKGMLVQAVAMYNQVLEQEPDNADAVHLLGVAAAQSGQHDLAVEFIRRAIVLNPAAPQFYQNLSVSLRELGNSAALTQCLREAVRHCPNDATVHRLLGDVLKQQGDLDGAAEAFRSTLGICPVDEVALRELGQQFEDPARVRYSACPLCHSTSLRVLRNQDWRSRAEYQPELSPYIRWMKCDDCGHQFTWGYHSESALACLFSRSYSGQSPLDFHSAQIEPSRYTWGRVVELVSGYQSEGTWLDVGTGSGILLGVARECGFEVCGTDARESTAQSLRDRGYEVYTEDLSYLAGRLPEHFDVVSLCDVVEHFPFPRLALQSSWDLLHENGILFISCPNRDSVLWRAFDEEGINPYWSEVEHYHNFSYASLRQILVLEGFEPIRCLVSNRYRSCMDVIARKACRKGSGH